MSAQAILSQQTLVYNQAGSSRNQIELRRAEIRSFERALSRGIWRTRLARFTGRSTKLLQSGETKSLRARKAGLGVQFVALDDIVGSEGRSSDFDNHFWPLKKRIRDRWVNIAVAMSKGVPMPPVELIETAEGYFVRDGHHRLSVARTVGREVIEAEIV